MGAQPAPAQGVDPGAITGPADPLGRILKGFLVSFHNQPTGTFWALYTAKNAIGRAQSGEALDIEINDPTTSSRHAQITFDSPRGPLLEDLGSTNGTFLNEQPIGYQGSVELHDGDRIRFGGYNTVVRLVSNQS
jgi:pSer/pThr/pTyr-binding forkhead associated (FHA) protein